MSKNGSDCIPASQRVSLPDELVLEVLGYMTQEDVTSLSLVSRRFNSLCKMKLFKNIYVSGSHLKDRINHPKSISSPFYKQYTVMNYLSFMRFINSVHFQPQLIRKVVFYEPIFSALFLNELMNHLPLASFYIEKNENTMFQFNAYKTLDHNLKVDGIQRLDVMTLELIDNPVCNYPNSVKELAIDFTTVEDSIPIALNNCRAVFPHLRSLKLKHVDSSILDDFAKTVNQKLTVKSLSISMRSGNLQPALLEKCFDFEKITRLELFLAGCKSGGADLSSLAGKFPSVTSVAISCRTYYDHDYLRIFQDNTLEEITLNMSTPQLSNRFHSNTTFIAGLIERQAHSLKKLDISMDRFIDRSSSHNLDDMDRFYVSQFSSEDAADVIKGAKELNTKEDHYRQLRYIRYNGVPVLIERSYGEFIDATVIA
ncbi:uncharacterized protein RJT20DRAFT_133654 [Scheffersomyces xylosifermentans]|uniref:uncharacterized protein n=1 Tax=Scheffersomyces xylosifermentans TaxID=1304137 RepID=UPI00315C809B